MVQQHKNWDIFWKQSQNQGKKNEDRNWEKRNLQQNEYANLIKKIKSTTKRDAKKISELLIKQREYYENISEKNGFNKVFL